MKKILISTLGPLGGNYGGLLQAYALQKVLRDMGYDVTTDDRIIPVRTFRNRLGGIKRFVNMTIFKNAPSHIDVSTVPEFAVYTKDFVERTMQTVDLLCGKRRPRASDVEQYDIFVTGSDQVWRANYTDVPMQLFDYVLHDSAVKLSYAASFGTDDLSSYNARLTAETKLLAQKFSGVSVREDSGVRLAAELWGVKAEHHIDPTLLLSADDYARLITTSPTVLKQSPGELFVYVLDESETSKKIVNKAAATLELKAFELLPEKFLSRKELKTHPEKYALPPIEQWLKSFQDAEFVITDSFHGCAFSIIFNKPFIAIGNRQRGMARFTSLLKLFGLEDRLVADASEVTEELLKSKIDWKKVNDIKKKELRRSMEYLNKHLNQS